MILKTALLLACAWTVCLAGEKDVLEFTDDDFATRIAEHDVAVVMFYAPWCGHCKRLKPEYEKAAPTLRDNDPPVALVKVDCTEAGKETCNKHGVSGYPTIKIFRGGEVAQDYSGPREADGIVKYMRSQVGPSSKELKSVADFDKFTSKAEVVVVGFFKEDSDLKKAFVKLADILRERVSFGNSADEAVLKKADTTDGIILYRPKHLANKFEPSNLKYDGAANKDAIEKWINKNYHGLVGHRTRDTSKDFENPLIVAYYTVDYAKNPKGTNYWRNRILKVAQEYKDDFTFAISAKDDFQHELNEFGLDYVAGDKPIVFARDAKNRKFSMKEDFTVESFQAFLKDLKADKLEPYLKSEPIPDDNSGPVVTAVGKNFDDVVTNVDKDVLVEFYAPWCGHCKKLTPIYDELGEKMKGEDVSIVKMDATANDVPSTFDVRGFPTIYWVPKNKKDSPVRYEGGREVSDFVEYIAKHATNELKSFDRKGNEKKKEEL
ncbi:protein disulfide-isomerase A3 [Neocloeon triangulifer]|uniref:protein disulfide-isomerase A3 n=1 Tax=Neocloeon triangulifer TaxID=2078957 RepID=UPI00286F200C|nr:protein disulfide-isomerase A3 [Neocloeon triangulifer]